jgi:hypothetical protein
LLTYHTYGGEIREPLAATDSEDLNTFKQLTTQGLLQSGYDKVRSGIGGAFLNWAYKQRGIVAYLTEVWNLQKAAGVTAGATSGTGNDASAAAIGGMNTESESLAALSLRGEHNILGVRAVYDLQMLLCWWWLDVLDIMSWCEDKLPAGSFWQDWTPFDHPQLGPVEIGGWKWKNLSQNPPTVMLGCVIQSSFVIM